MIEKKKLYRKKKKQNYFKIFLSNFSVPSKKFCLKQAEYIYILSVKWDFRNLKR